MFDVNVIRKDFPILDREVNGSPLIYFDNGATSQTPSVVTEAITDYYNRYNANIHRGVHRLSQEATDAYERSRNILQKHINAAHSYEVIFTAGTTESINLVASSFTQLLSEGDEIIISALEHHSNIVPWQLLCERTGAVLKVIPMLESGNLDMTEYGRLLSDKTKLVACNHISNALGVINDIQEIITKAHEVDAAVFIDGAQSCPHIQTDVQALDVDFYTGSAHKMYGPTGVGFLYGKEEWLRKMPPYQGGGEMIAEVTFEKTTYADLPHKFEAGTPNICDGIAYGVAIEYLQKIGFEQIQQYEQKLLAYATQQLLNIEGLRIYGDVKNKAAVISFNIKDIHPYDLGSILDQQGVAVRTGHHCTQPIMDYYQIAGTVRASFSFYNTIEEIDKMIAGISKACKMLT